LPTVRLIIGGLALIQLQRANGAVLATPSEETVVIRLVGIGIFIIIFF